MILRYYVLFLVLGLWVNPWAASRTAQRDSIRAALASGKPFTYSPPTKLSGAESLEGNLASSTISASQPQQPLPIADSVVIPSLTIRDTEIRDLLQGLAVQYNLNLFLAPEVKGPISVQLSHISLKDALQTIITQNGYEYSVERGVINIHRKREQAILQAAAPETRFVVQWKDERLTLDIEKTPLEKVVRAIIEATGKNIVIETGAETITSVLVKNMSLTQAIQLLARSNGLTVKERNGYFSIALEAYSPGSKNNGTSASNQFWVKVNSTDSTVSLDATEAPLAGVVNEILAQSGLNSMVYGKVEGQITTKLENIPVLTALRHLFRGTKYSVWERNGVVFVGGHEMQTAENSALIRLKHMRAEDAIKLIPPDLVKDMQVQVVRSQNGLMVVGPWETIDAISQYVEKMDLPIPQILIEALVLDVDMERARSYGLNLFIGKATPAKSPEPLYPDMNQTLNGKQITSLFAKIGLNDVIHLPAEFGAQIQAAEQDKILNVKARSQIATLNGETAVLTIGQTQYFLMKSETDFNQGAAVTNKTTERFEKIEANSTLTVTPYVTGEREVTCEIIPDFSEPEGSFDSRTPPTLNKRYVKSSVRLRAGETIVLGGMVKETQNEVRNQVPFLGSIPVLGWLFRNVQTVKTRRQLLIFVTPTIYYGDEAKVDVSQVEKAMLKE